MVSIYAYLSTYVKKWGRNDQGGNGIGGETTRVCGAKRLGLKIEAKRLGGKLPGGKRLGGETSCYRSGNTRKFRVPSFTGIIT